MGKEPCSWRARRSVSRPVNPGMRTSEIIMLIFCSRRTCRARSPEETGTVLKPWLERKESSRLRWAASSSTMRRRGVFELEDSGGMLLILILDFKVRDAEERPGRFIGQAFDLPAVGQDDLLHDGQAQAGAFRMGGKVG